MSRRGKIITVVCNDTAANHLTEILKAFKSMGGLGCTRDFQLWGPGKNPYGDESEWFTFDGDGPDRIHSLCVTDIGEEK